MEYLLPYPAKVSEVKITPILNEKKWSSNVLFQGLNDEQLSVIKPYIQSVAYAPSEVIMQEGDPGNFALLIQSGSVAIHKNELLLAERESGDLVGLMSLIDQNPRSATVSAGLSGCSGHRINKEGFDQIMDDGEDSAATKILYNYIGYQQDDIRETNTLSLNEARAKLDQEQQRVMSAQFFVRMMVGLVFFMFMLGFLQQKATETDSTFISFALIAVYGILSYIYVRRSGLPPEMFGLTNSNLKSALKFGLTATAIAIPLLVFTKWVMITFFPEHFGNQLIELYEVNGNTPIWIILVLYSIHAVLQEFIVRGCLQGGLDQFLTGKKSGWTAIIISTLIFSSFHLMKDMKFALLAIIPSLFWGYLFYKNKNIVAVSISHILIGLVAIFVLNIVG